MPIELTTEKLEGLSIVSASGPINAQNCSILEKHLSEMIGNGERRIIIDLKDVQYISSAGLRVLLITAKTLSQSGRLALANLNERVNQIIAMCFNNVMEIFNDIESAKKAFSKGVIPGNMKGGCVCPVR